MDRKLESRLKAVKARADSIKSDPALRHIPNQHDVEKCSENARLLRIHQEKAINNRVCAQPYTILKSLFNQSGVWCAGKLSPEMLDEIDAKLYIGLCMGMQNDEQSEKIEESSSKEIISNSEE